MNYFGIKNSYAKKVLLERGRFRMVKRDTSELAYDCRRHVDLVEKLEKFKSLGVLEIQKLEGLNGTLYAKVNKFYGDKTTEQVLYKMKEVMRLYEKVKNGEDKTPIAVTSSGARLDGSHRAGMLKSMNVREADAKEIYGPRVFVWLVGREAARKRVFYDKYSGRAAYAKGKRLGTVLYTDFVRWDPFSIIGRCYHVLDTGDIVDVRRCYLEK